jgi:hypothetical protein
VCALTLRLDANSDAPRFAHCDFRALFASCQPRGSAASRLDNMKLLVILAGIGALRCCSASAGMRSLTMRCTQEVLAARCCRFSGLSLQRLLQFIRVYYPRKRLHLPPPPSDHRTTPSLAAIHTQPLRAEMPPFAPAARSDRFTNYASPTASMQKAIKCIALPWTASESLRTSESCNAATSKNFGPHHGRDTYHATCSDSVALHRSTSAVEQG